MRRRRLVFGIAIAFVVACGSFYGDEGPSPELPSRDFSEDAGVPDVVTVDDAALDPNTCITPAARCLPSAPAGWTGPFSIYDGTPTNAPACGAVLPAMTFDANANLDLKAAVCPCSCSATPSPTPACGTTTLTGYTDTGCANPCAGAPPLVYNAQTACIAGYTKCNGVQPINSLRVVSDSPTGGQCPSNQAAPPSFPPVPWKSTLRGCGANAPQRKSCGEGELCFPIAKSPFEPKLCISKPGSSACPGFPYSRQRTAYLDKQERRTCTACTCGFTTRGVCEARFHGQNLSCTATTCACVSDNAFETPWYPSSQTPCVTQTLDDPAGLRREVRNSGAQCGATQVSTPQGTVTPEKPITICCEP